MKRNYITIVAVAFLMVGCGTSETENTAGSEVTENVEQEESEPKELSTKELILGDWQYNYDMDETVLEILLTLRGDGTYFQSMGGNPVDGTWEFIDDEHIVVKNPNIKSEEGQTWQIVKATEDELHIDWNVSRGEAKVLAFQRKG